MLCSVDIRCANFSNFPMVTPMLLPISAALLANSDLLGFPSGLPFAAAFCESVRRDCLCAPTFDEACRRCTCVRTERNSLVRSCIEETAIASDGNGQRVKERMVEYGVGRARSAQDDARCSPSDDRTFSGGSDRKMVWWYYFTVVVVGGIKERKGSRSVREDL